jgi:membrane dipeptidase
MTEPPEAEPTYSAYGYLDPDVGFQRFELAPELGRVPPWDPALSEDQVSRVTGLLGRCVVVSFHDHPVRFPTDMAETPSYNRTGRQHTAFAGLAASPLTAVFDNMMDGTGCVTGNAPWKWLDVVTDLGMRQADIAHQDHVRIARKVGDIKEAKARDGVAIVLGLEAATPIENELDRLDVLYGLGVRQIGIAYNDANTLGSGLAESNDGGLTTFGHKAVRRMNQLCLLVDLSHSSDRTSLDVCRASTSPVCITHAGARSVWPTRRMKPDEVLRAVADTGGVIGMSAAPHTTLSAAHPRHSIESVLDHFDYCVSLVGKEHVAFGPDTLYGDHVAMHRVFSKVLELGKATAGPPFTPVEYVDGLENPTECFSNLCAALVKRGWSDADIALVLGGNVMRVLEEVWR